jgi:hypothetical protein
MVAVALASALAELEQDGRVTLNPRQKEVVWSAFDQAMDRALEEVPAGCSIKVLTTPAATLTRHGSREGTKDGTQATGAAGIPATRDPPTTTDGSARVAVLPEHQFPLYRRMCGVTTMVLKDPTVVVSRRNGEEEALALDYLTVRVKEVGDEAGGRGKRKRPRR